MNAKELLKVVNEALDTKGKNWTLSQPVIDALKQAGFSLTDDGNKLSAVLKLPIKVNTISDSDNNKYPDHQETEKYFDLLYPQIKKVGLSIKVSSYVGLDYQDRTYEFGGGDIHVRLGVDSVNFQYNLFHEEISNWLTPQGSIVLSRLIKQIPAIHKSVISQM